MQVEPGAYVGQGLRFRRARQAPAVDKTSAPTAVDAPYGELFEYPGLYIKTPRARRLHQAPPRRAAARLPAGSGNRQRVAAMAPGFLFSLTDHPAAPLNREYLVTSAHLRLTATQHIDRRPRRRARLHAAASSASTASATSGHAADDPQTARPRTADRHGRRPQGRGNLDRQVRAREGAVPLGSLREASDEKSSCWVRVSQVWAGSGGAPCTSRASGRRSSSTSSRAIPTGRSSPAASTTATTCRPTRCRPTRPRAASRAAAPRAAAPTTSTRSASRTRRARSRSTCRRRRTCRSWSRTTRRARSNTTGSKTSGTTRPVDVGSNRTRDVGKDETHQHRAEPHGVGRQGREHHHHRQPHRDRRQGREHHHRRRRAETVGQAEDVTVGGTRSLTVGITDSTTVGGNQSVDDRQESERDGRGQAHAGGQQGRSAHRRRQAHGHRLQGPHLRDQQEAGHHGHATRSPSRPATPASA